MIVKYTTDYERIVYCMKLWVKEIQKDPENMDNEGRGCVAWIVATCKNEIFNGTYCDNKEYNEYLITGEI